MLKDLPVELSQQEERMLQWIVIPKVSKAGTRSLVMLVTVSLVVMLGMIWAFFYVPMGDLSKYKSIADTCYSVLPVVAIFFGCYVVVKSIKIRNELIQKLYHALTSMDAPEVNTKAKDD